MLVSQINRRIPRLIFLGLLAGTASAAALKPVVTASHREYFEAIKNARAAAVADCRAKPQTFLIQEFGQVARFAEYTWALRNVKANCVAGKRDGAASFELTETERKLVGKKASSISQTSAAWSGELVVGVEAGIWCRGPQSRKTSFDASAPKPNALPSDKVAQCLLLGVPDYYESNRRFARRADGRWLAFEQPNTPGIIDELVPAEMLEERSRALIDARRRGQEPPPAMPFTLEIPLLADLVSSGRVTFAPDKAPKDLTRRTVGVVFTTRAGDELRAWSKARAALIDATAGVKTQDPRAYQRFLVASEPRRLLEAMAQAFRPHSARLRTLPDLAPLVAGEVDYAFVVDWKIELRPDVLGSYDALRKATPKASTLDLVTTRVGYLLLDRDLTVVAKWNTSLGVGPYRWMFADNSRQAGGGNREYLDQLTQQLVYQWGVVEPASSSFNMAHYSLVPFDGRPQ